MQLFRIRNNVLTRMGIDPTDANYPPQALNLLINSALRRISLEYEWPWLMRSTAATLAAGDTEIQGIPADARKIVSVREGQFDLPYRLPRWYPRMAEINGRPRFWTTQAGNTSSREFHALPMPDQAYALTVTYLLTTEPELVGDTDEPNLPDYAIELLIAFVGVQIARRGRDTDMEKLFFSEYQRILRDLKDDVLDSFQGVLPYKQGRYFA